MEGLKEEIPDLQARVNHILTKQVFGIGITHLTAMLARRSLYCSKHAKGPHSIAKGFKSDAGNIWFERLEHTWQDGKCTYCGASQATLDRGEGRETHAYAFIHTDDIKARMAELFGGDMQFDVIIGNPPYQLDDGGYGKSAAPIYHLFVEQAKKLEPRYLSLVIPARWFAGGKGLDKYRERMLSDRRLRKLVDYPKLYEGFPGVKIRGGISYFLWDRDHNGPCEVQTIWDGQPTGPAVARYLDAYDILIRRNEAVPILEKVRAKGEPTLDSRVSSRKPFGFPTNFHGKPAPKGLKKPVKLYGSQNLPHARRAARGRRKDPRLLPLDLEGGHARGAALFVERQDALRQDLRHLSTGEEARRQARAGGDLQARGGGCLAERPRIPRGLRRLAVSLAQLGPRPDEGFH
nr:Eco57I restriction-modification methylase domain-containing protein [Candidatus Nitrospira inopinata]